MTLAVPSSVTLRVSLLAAMAAAASCSSTKNEAPTGAGGMGGGTSASGGTGRTETSSDAGVEAEADAGDAGTLVPITLHLVGDSTVAAFKDPYYYPRYGYGTQLGQYFDKKVTINNLALSGRSSKSFINSADNSNYAALKSMIKAGDYLLIAFGHNDEKADGTLYTNPNTDVSDPASFKYNLYNNYIQVAKAAGATPILATPIVRRDAAGVYAGAKQHITTDVVSGGVTYPGGDYPKAIRDLGDSLGLTVVDNTASTLALGKQIFATSGATGTANLQAWVSDSITSVDDTHTNIYGAAYYAYLVADAIRTSSSPLKAYVLPGITPPASAVLVQNPSWAPPIYAPPVKGSLWTSTDPWMGSVFGDVGSTDALSDGSYAITETSMLPLTVSLRSGTETSPSGKIAAATDGIAFYFQAVPIAKDFTLTATATVDWITYNNSQVGFGLMVRDAVWMDTYNPGLLSSWVSAGSLKGNAPASAWSSFVRDTTAATQLTGTTVSAGTPVPVAGSSFDLKIVKVGNSYTCTYDKEPPKSYSVDLGKVDSQYVYAGVFTARECKVTFSNVQLTISN